MQKSRSDSDADRSSWIPFLGVALRCLALLVTASFVAGCALGGRPEGADYDPVTQDPLDYDAQFPPQIIDTVFDVNGADVNVLLYQAQGAGPHPTVVLLHGFPGFEKNLDLAQAIRRAGWNVIFFHYRGSWGSGGRFSFAHVLEDVHAVIEQSSRAAFAVPHRIDSERLALIGHSMGGFAALVVGAERDDTRCVGSLAGGNFGALAEAIEASPDVRRQMAANLDRWSGPLVGPDGATLVEEVLSNADRFDTRRYAKALAGKSLLLTAASLDDVTPITLHHDPLVEELRKAGAKELTTRVFPNDGHSFSAHRIALARTLVGWLDSSCRSTF